MLSINLIHNIHELGTSKETSMHSCDSFLDVERHRKSAGTIVINVWLPNMVFVLKVWVINVITNIYSIIYSINSQPFIIPIIKPNLSISNHNTHIIAVHVFCIAI